MRAPCDTAGYIVWELRLATPQDVTCRTRRMGTLRVYALRRRGESAPELRTITGDHDARHQYESFSAAPRFSILFHMHGHRYLVISCLSVGFKTTKAMVVCMCARYARGMRHYYAVPDGKGKVNEPSSN